MDDIRALLSDHPSFFALDRAALGDASEPVRRHVAACEQCQARLHALADPAPLPAALEHRLRRESPARRARWPWARRAWTGGLVAAAAALVLITLVGRGPRGVEPAGPVTGSAGAGGAPREIDGVGAHDTVKGSRAVGVFVRRGRRTFLWDGRKPIRAGDALRLKLVPEGLGFVHVFSEVDGPGGATLQHLHQAALPPRRDAVLDAAWQVDGAARREVLIVVLSRAALGVDAARTAALSPGAPDADTWVARLVLPVAAPERRP